jgi:hypothetical protein
MTYLKQIDSVELKFKNFGFKTIDIQMNEPNVGIFEGWVIYESVKTGVTYEISWNDAEYYIEKNSIVNNSKIYTEI